ncbi:MAG: polysaccharide deacetylase family protein [Bacillota bacterium]|nr:polysaccharide deacetylase family protein [Bacillota bacterium]
MVSVGIILLLLVILYTIVPYMITRWAGFFVYQKGNVSSNIALTFDDGPSPKYTNELLDLLKQHKIKASFFVVGSKAKQHPDIIMRMHHEGHLIGIHNYVHHSNWFMLPHRVSCEVEETAKVIQNIIGVKPAYYRPPWGMMNFFDLFAHKKYHIILWSLMVGDWKSKGSSRRIEKRLLKGTKPGDIVLLHDSGETWGADEDAPQFTIEALRTVIKELKGRGYTFARVDEMIS